MATQNLFADPEFLYHYAKASPKYGNALRLFIDAMVAQEEKQRQIIAQRQEQRNQLLQSLSSQNQGY